MSHTPSAKKGKPTLTLVGGSDASADSAGERTKGERRDVSGEHAKVGAGGVSPDEATSSPPGDVDEGAIGVAEATSPSAPVAPDEPSSVAIDDLDSDAEVLSAPPADVRPPLPLGKIGAHVLLCEVAAGGMATVFVASGDKERDPDIVAVKRPHRHLATDKTYISMLVDEARLAAAIEHPNVVRVRRLAFERDAPYIVMDYIDGVSLSELRKALGEIGRAIDARIALRIVLDALAGLHAAHELAGDDGEPLGIIHRDVSPHNVLVGSDGRSRLTDFGIAKAADRVQVTRTNEVKGKLAYLAPERVDKRRMCTRQSDVFSMGVVLWECIAGRRLFRGDEAVDTLHEVMSLPIPRLRKLGAFVSEPLDQAIMRALSRDLDERYATAESFARALERAAGKRQIASPEEVRDLLVAVAGPTLRIRHAQIRRAIGEARARAALASVGGELDFSDTDTESIELQHKELIARVAPPAPSARYAFAELDEAESLGEATRRRWPLAVGGVLGVALIGIATSSMWSRTAQRSASDTHESQQPVIEARARRVILALPFASMRVILDDKDRVFESPVETAAFELGAGSGARHKWIAVASDGTRAEGFATERDGVLEIEEETKIVIYPQTQPAESPSAPVTKARPVPRRSTRAKPPRKTPRIERTPDGFTKIR